MTLEYSIVDSTNSTVYSGNHSWTGSGSNYTWNVSLAFPQDTTPSMQTSMSTEPSLTQLNDSFISTPTPAEVLAEAVATTPRLVVTTPTLLRLRIRTLHVDGKSVFHDFILRVL